MHIKTSSVIPFLLTLGFPVNACLYHRQMDRLHPTESICLSFSFFYPNISKICKATTIHSLPVLKMYRTKIQNKERYQVFMSPLLAAESTTDTDHTENRAIKCLKVLVIRCYVYYINQQRKNNKGQLHQSIFRVCKMYPLYLFLCIKGHNGSKTGRYLSVKILQC